MAFKSGAFWSDAAHVRASAPYDSLSAFSIRPERADQPDESEARSRGWKRTVGIAGLAALAWVAACIGTLQLIQAQVGSLTMAPKAIIGFLIAMLVTVVVQRSQQSEPRQRSDTVGGRGAGAMGIELPGLDDAPGVAGPAPADAKGLQYRAAKRAAPDPAARQDFRQRFGSYADFARAELELASRLEADEPERADDGAAGAELEFERMLKALRAGAAAAPGPDTPTEDRQADAFEPPLILRAPLVLRRRAH